MPDNVIVREPFQRTIRDMLTYSPTSRAQCTRIAAASHLRVVMRLDLRTRQSDAAARTIFTYSRTGDLLARIDLQVGSNYAPVVAHEFEHVIEQLDRWRLPEMAAAGAGVSEVEPGIFETERAIRAGNAVDAEMFARRRTTHLATPREGTPTSTGQPLPPDVDLSGARVLRAPGRPGS